MNKELTPIAVAKQKSKLATTPKESFANEAEWKAAEAWANETRNYELVVEAFRGWILQRRHTTELIEPTIKHGGYRHGHKSQMDDVVHLTADYGFTPKQWSRRKKELDVAEDEIDWYFYGYSLDDDGALAAWWLIDMSRVREEGILDMDNWQVHPNGDGTSGMYIPLRILEELGCVIDFCDG